MLTAPKVCGPDARVADLRDLFEDDHVHSALVADGRRLVSVVERPDLVGAPAEAPAARFGRLDGRTIAAQQDLVEARRLMLAERVRRLAVVDDGELVGLLCLKRGGDGFCTEEGVAARAAERAAGARIYAATPFDAIVLAGGRATRMGGRDKTVMTIGGIAMVDRVLASVSAARQVVMVGPEVDGGPVAALASALPGLEEDVVVTLAGDMPFVGGAIHPLLAALAAAPDDTHAAVLVADGRRQYLAAAWRRSALAWRLAAVPPRDAPMRALFTDQVVEVPDAGGWSLDIDTPDDLAAARADSSRVQLTRHERR